MKTGTSMAKSSFMARGLDSARLLLPLFILAALSLATSCTDYDNGFDEAMIRYNQNFIDRFGQIDPNQDWNLVRQLAEKNGGGRSTRAYDYGDIEGDNKNAPEWNLWPEARTTNNLVIPGYPDRYGTYHVEDKNGDSNVKYLQEEPEGEENPMGDVTTEEVVYVSQWFRTHRYPQSLKAEWKDFFLQDVSHDCDRVITTADDGTETCDEGERIIIGHIYNADGSTNSDCENPEYPMDELIAKTKEGSWHHLYNFNYGSGNHLQHHEKAPRFTDFKYDGENPSASGASTTNYHTPDDYKPGKRTIQLYVGVGTDDFAYYSSFDSQWHRKYVMVHLQFTIQQSGEMCPIHNKECTEHEYDGYYLGFDYESYEELYNTDGDLEKYLYWQRDGFYSNWIVKISHTPWNTTPEEDPCEEPKPDPTPDNDEEDPVPPHMIKDQGLLVCEDLGSQDYDFNDIVLKVQHISSDNGKDQLRFTAMAAGGTLPSKIFYKGEEVEVGDDATSEIHELLYKNAPEIINAGAHFGQEGKVWYIAIDDEDLNAYKESDNQSGFASYAFDKGYIQVQVDGKAWVRNIKSSYRDTPDDTHSDMKEQGVPQMMFLPTSFIWPMEQTPIGDAYPMFSTWVGDASTTNWYLRSNANKDLVTKRDVSDSGSEFTGMLRWPDISDATKSITINLGETTTLNYYGQGPISIPNIGEDDCVSVEDIGSNSISITAKGTGEKHLQIQGPKNTIYLNVTVTLGDELRWPDVDGDTKEITLMAGGENESIFYLGQGELVQDGDKNYDHNLIQINGRGSNTYEIVPNQNNATGDTYVYIKSTTEDGKYIRLHVIVTPNRNILGWPAADDVYGETKSITLTIGEEVTLKYYGTIASHGTNGNLEINVADGTLTIKAIGGTDNETIEILFSDANNHSIKLKITLKKNEDGNLTWDDGSTGERTINMTVGEQQSISYKGSGKVIDGYDTNMIQVNSGDQNPFTIQANHAGDPTTVTIQGTKNNLTIKVTVTEQTNTAKRR